MHTSTAPATDAGPLGEARGLVVSRLSPLHDDWDLDEDLRHVERLLGIERNELALAVIPFPTGPGPTPSSEDPAADAMQGPSPSPPTDACPRPRPQPVSPRRPNAFETFQSRALLPLLTWLAMMMGTTALACGGVLLAWAALGARPDLWRMGQPIVMGGVCALVVAGVMRLDRRWQEKRTSAPADPSVPPPGELEGAGM